MILSYPPAGLTVGQTAPSFGSSNFGSNPAPKIVSDSSGLHPYLVEFTCTQTGGRCEFIGSDKIQIGTERWWLLDLLFPSDAVIDADWWTVAQIHDAQPPGAVGNPLIQAVVRPDGSLRSVIRTREDVNNGVEQVLVASSVRGCRVYIAMHVIGGQVAEMWAQADTRPDLTLPAGARQTLTWRTGDYAYGPQGHNYRGSATAGTAVVRLGHSSYASTLSEAQADAGWTASAPPPPSGPTASEVWTQFEAAALFKKWQQANPVEAAQIRDYWLKGGTAPTARTAFGKGLVLEALRYG